MAYYSTKWLLPLIAFLLFGSLAVGLWQDQNDHEREMVVRHAETSADQLRIRIEGLMNARIASLKLMADRYVERLPFDFSEQRFNSFVEVLFRYYQGFAAIYWINGDGSVRWAYPRQSNATPLGSNDAEHPDARCQAALVQARDERRDVITPTVAHRGGVMGFDIFVPLVADDTVQGVIDGLFLIPQLMEFCVPPVIKEDFCITLYDGEQPIYATGTPRSASQGTQAVHAQQVVFFGGRRWELNLEPSAAYYKRNSSKHYEVLAFGLVFSAVVSLLLYALARRMEMYKETRDQALREVTERKRVEAVLLDNERKLEGLLDELSAKNAEMESFVYTVSHDLKTPIVTIEGFIGALREDFADRLSETGEQYLRYMSEAARKMEVLINDLLNLSRIGRLSETKVEFSFGDLAREAVDILRPLLESGGIEVEVQADLPLVYGERKRIGQIIDNLLSNAVKYIGRNNPSPRIEVGCQEENGQRVFFVRDNGMGIEERYFEKIFQIFERLPAAKKVGEGTGIGLTIVKRIVELHGGRIWLTSEIGKGTTFFFTLEDKDA